MFIYMLYSNWQSRAITSPVWTDDHRLLQESNLTAWQPRSLLITLYI